MQGQRHKTVVSRPSARFTHRRAEPEVSGTKDSKTTRSYSYQLGKTGSEPLPLNGCWLGEQMCTQAIKVAFSLCGPVAGAADCSLETANIYITCRFMPRVQDRSEYIQAPFNRAAPPPPAHTPNKVRYLNKVVDRRVITVLNSAQRLISVLYAASGQDKCACAAHRGLFRATNIVSFIILTQKKFLEKDQGRGGA